MPSLFLRGHSVSRNFLLLKHQALTVAVTSYMGRYMHTSKKISILRQQIIVGTYL